TPRVCCAVSAVIAERPWTPWAAKVLRSAWMPAPPPESEPAMVSAEMGLVMVGYCDGVLVGMHVLKGAGRMTAAIRVLDSRPRSRSGPIQRPEPEAGA